MELNSRKMDAVEALMQLDNDKFIQAEKCIRMLLSESKTQVYNMPADLLNSLLGNSEKRLSKGSYIEEQEMNNFIDSL